MRIAGIHPQKATADIKMQHAVSEPYGLEKVLSVARRAGHEVDLFVPLRGEEDLLARVKRFDPDVACYSVYTCQYPMAERIATSLKAWKDGIVNVAGNRYPTFLGEEITFPFDFFVMREGEATFEELLLVLDEGRGFEGVRGLVRRRNGSAVANPPRPRITSLDDYPDALRHPDILAQPYRSISVPPLSSNPRYAIVEYSRGCLGTCNFCDNGGFWRTREIQLTYRSPERVVREMKTIMERVAEPVVFFFMDLNFTADTDRAFDLVREMRRQDLKAAWYCMSNISTADGQEEILAAMREAGCYKIAFGVESTRNSFLKRMNKSVNGSVLTREETHRVLEMTASLGLINQAFYMIGLEWEDEQSILEDARSLQDLTIHLLSLGIYTPVPLSRLYERYVLLGIDPDLERHDRDTLIFKHPNGLTNETLKNLQVRIYSAFYATHRYRENVETLLAKRPELLPGFNDFFDFLEMGIRF